MTIEIWAAVIIAITQIIVMISIGWWQINIAKQLAKPKEKQETNKEKILEKLTKKLTKFDLHIIVPLLLNVTIITLLIQKNGINIYVAPMIIWTSMSLILQVITNYLFSIIKKLLDVITHIMNRLVCHESILFEIADKPCKDDGKCKFEA